MKHAVLLMAAVAIGGVWLAMTPAPAQAGSDQDNYDQALARCQTFAKDNDVSVEPCQCIAKAVSGDPELMKEDAEITTMDEFQNASQAYKDAVNPCLPEDQQVK
jgi:hypothetical protein